MPLLAWLVSRFIGCLGLVIGPHRNGRWLNTFGLTYMDGGWYRIILNQGYPSGPLPDYATTWPFFPLYPWITDGLTRFGIPNEFSLIAVSWLFAFFAFVGMYELVRRRFGESVAQHSVWCLALFPGAVGQVLSYSDSMFVAGLVWTLVIIDRIQRDRVTDQSGFDRRWWLAGLTSLVITASRPNGILVLLALIVAVLLVQRRVINMIATVLPSAIFLGVWMTYSQSKTGDALAFLTAKNAWLETTIFDFFAHPFEREAMLTHVITFVIAGAIALKNFRLVPIWWQIICLVLLVPSLVLGVEGLARYVSMTPPLLIMTALTIDRWPRNIRAIFYSLAGLSMLYLSVNVVRFGWVP